MCVIIFNGNETINIITVNVMVGLSFLHFLIILVYHVFAYMVAIHCTRLIQTIVTVRNYTFEKCCKQPKRDSLHGNFTMEIPEAQYNFANFQEPLIGED